jgi:glycine cleavage system aminomethyltransferase T
MADTQGYKFGIVGGVVAAVLSYVKWHSIALALVHGAILGWIYVIYFLIRYGFHHI